MVTERELFQSNSDFCVGGWMKCEIYKRQLDARDGLLARIIEIAARIKKREDKPQTNNTQSSHTSCEVY
jgi:hypothetical protein